MNSHHSQRVFHNVLFPLVVFTTFYTFMAREAQASVKMPRVFGSNMVLQRDFPTPIWGWASLGKKVVVVVCSQRKAIIANEQCVWRVELTPQPVGDPYDLTVRGTNLLAFTNVYYREVWLCAGHSNVLKTRKKRLKTLCIRSCVSSPFLP